MQKINHDFLFGLINCKLRLCIMTILRGKPNDLLVVMGILCSTWTIVNAGTSGRDVLCPMGRVEYESVSSANLMVARPLSAKIVHDECNELLFVYG